MTNKALVVFSDLDATLLDHSSYSFEAAKPMLDELLKRSIPLVLNTSKTAAELFDIRAQLNNNHPFIVENGAAVFIPQDYFSEIPEDAISKYGYWIKSFAPERYVWSDFLASLPYKLKSQFTSFSEMGEEGIMEATGLSIEEALKANQRDYSEPILWQGNDEQKRVFREKVENAGYTLVEGGRFLHITNGYSKALGMLWLEECYEKEWGVSVSKIALGDGGNDVAMLEAADFPVVIRVKDKAPLKINANSKVIVTQEVGPAGWNASIERLLKELEHEIK